KQSPLPTGTAPQGVLAGGGCLGADALLRLVGSYSRCGGGRGSVTVGVVGFPNVGKSSLINSLKRSRVCGVGATPGITKSLQAVQLDRHIRLLDCPGVVLGGHRTPPAGAVAPARLKDPLGAAEDILRRCPPQQVNMG
ncbi:GNL3L protein, partial [Urocolius indicus]|nr:GNL3L protein [Urocolius indicus]